LNPLTRETAADRRESDAVLNARNRIAQLADTKGARSPEYATALNQLALLLIMQGDPDAAVPLLRQALEIRRATLGESHPDVATNLSSLGGLLWARGHLEEAEPLLRQAADVRVATLGESHPKSIVSRKSLEQLLKSKIDLVGVDPPAPPLPGVPVAEVEAAVPAPPVVTPPSAALDAASGERAVQIAARVEQVRSEFEALAQRLTRVGEGLRSGVVPAEVDLADAWAVARDGFARVRDEAIDASTAESVPIPAGGLASLADIAALLPALREAEGARLTGQAVRLDALRALDRVDRLVCRYDPTFAPLGDCQARSRALRKTIESSPPAVPPAEAVQLREGAHPLNALLRLVAADESTDDAEWSDRFDAVVAEFGNPLAVAVARSRITEGRD
jgi:tetratricopeptide (TPR) repeat protein